MKAVFSILFISIIAESLGSTPIPFSGKLSVADVNFNGSVEFAFSISDSENKVHWRNGEDANSTISIFVQNGRYTALLGGQGMNPLPPELFLEKKDLSLQVSCDLKDGHGLRLFEEKHSIGAQPFALASELSNLAMRAESANTVANGSITRESLSEILKAELNATIGRDRLSQEVLNSLGGEIVITRNMLPQEVRDELNATITRERLSADVVADLNRTIGVANLSKEVTDKLNQTFSIDAGSITLDQLSEQVRDDINGAITRDRLSSDLLLELNRTITMSMLSQDVLDELNTSSESSSGTTGPQTEVADGSIGLSKLSSEVSNALKPVVIGQPSSVVGMDEQSVVLDVDVDGANLSFQWKKDGVDITGETGRTLSIADLNASQHEGNYTVVVSNAFGSVTSSVARIDVNGSLTEGLVGWWKFDETEGTVASDSSGNGNDGNLTNGPTWTKGKIGGALSFDGVDDYVDLGNNYNNLEDLTLSAWVKFSQPQNLPSFTTIIANRSVFVLNITTAGMNYSCNFAAGGPWQGGVKSNSQVRENLWDLVTCTRSDGNVSLLVNTLFEGSTTNAASGTSSYNTSIGNNFGTSYYFSGLIDDVRIFDRALSAFEVKALYELGEQPVQVSGSGTTTVVNGTVTDGSITTNQLSEQILKYLKPVITQQPTASTIFADTNGTISLSAEGKYLTYQWKKNGVNLTGETNATLTITDANATQHDGNYSVVVSNDFGSVESAAFSTDVWMVGEDITDLVLWLDASRSSSFELNNSIIQNWKDLSGQGNDMNMTDGNASLTGQLNGRSVAYYDGNDITATAKNFGTDLDQSGYSIVALSRYAGSFRKRVITSSSGIRNWLLGHWDGGMAKFHAGTWVDNGVAADLNWHIYSVSHEPAISHNNNVAPLCSFWFDGTLRVSNSGASSDTAPAPSDIAFGGYASDERSTCEVAEFIMVGAEISDSDRQKIEGYLTKKWGLSAILPSTHPYKN